MAKTDLSAERLRELLDYNPNTGVFVWKKPTSNRVRVGTVAGTPTVKGYWHISVDKQMFYAHQLAWIHVHGSMPRGGLDHRDGDGRNNAIANLREATYLENGQNQKLRNTNKSGCTGVSWHSQRMRWTANIWSKGKRYFLGCFDSVQEAANAYAKAKEEMHTFQPVLRDA